jgi:signal transduction histidine kinase
MLERLNHFLAMTGLPPHGYCLLWDPWLVGAHVASDAVIALAYFFIPLVLLRLLKARQDIEFGWMVALFATFILACGSTHLLSIYVLWVPAYGLEAAVKVLTALASIATAALLVPLLPRLIALPSPSQLRAVNERLVAEGRERERTAEMLRQSQKLEALGRLTGGVAHDFNNLLQVVIGNLERAQRRAGSADPALDRALDQALTGAERAAELTDQLLTFARRQPLETRVLDLADVVAHARPLIERSVEQSITITVVAPDGPYEVLADHNQLDNALLNLAINARDAMPDGGALEFSLHAAAADQPIELRVVDTGTGMNAETLERATEPFFTTKPVGQGTGLGLSQVYGMIEQIGGSMKIESVPGTGTTVRLFLPRAAKPAAEVG